MRVEDGDSEDGAYEGTVEVLRAAKAGKREFVVTSPS